MDCTIPRIDPEAVLTYKFPKGKCSYTERDVVLYALGIGACGADPCDKIDLAYVYSNEGQHAVKVTYSSRVSQLHDKEKAAVLEIENECRESESGEVLCLSRMTIFLRGAGGFSKSASKPYSYDSRSPSLSAVIKLPIQPPKSAALIIHEDQIQPNQALLYRLSGDYNPLHSDPEVAEIAGFPRPILHGLCTLGFAVRAVVRHFCGGDPSSVQAIQGRFLLHVYPGETLVTKMWKDDSSTRIIFLCNVMERSRPVLSGFVLLRPSASL